MMILWGKRAAAVLSGIFLAALLFPVGSLWEGAAGGILNLALAMSEKFPSFLRRFHSSLEQATKKVLLA